MITVHRTSGQSEECPERELTLEWMQQQVGGYIEIVTAADRKSQLVVNEEGKLRGMPRNMKGTEWWEKNYGFTDVIVGDCIIVTQPHEVK